MKTKALLAGFLVVAAAILVPTAFAVVASASGSGHIRFGSSHEHISFSAVKNDDGTVSGHAVVADQTASGHVTLHIEINCLNVIGNVAIVSGIVTKSNREELVGFEGVFQVVDNGEGNDPPDLMSLVNLHEVGVGTDCTVPAEFDLAPIEGGNIRVDG
jgi:hypothetical protein